MKRRFTSHELYVLRNEIPIRLLIETKLEVPSKIQEGRFRFLSPCCREFNTGVQMEKNLVRCFRCEKRFNTIEITMAIRNCNFVNSVEYLQQYHLELFSESNGGRTPQSRIRFDIGAHASRREKCTRPLPINEILKNMTTKGAFSESAGSDTLLFNQKGQIMFRIEKMENEITRLSRSIEQIHTFLGIRGK